MGNSIKWDQNLILKQQVKNKTKIILISSLYNFLGKKKNVTLANHKKKLAENWLLI